MKQVFNKLDFRNGLYIQASIVNSLLTRLLILKLGASVVIGTLLSYVNFGKMSKYHVVHKGNTHSFLASILV